MNKSLPFLNHFFDRIILIFVICFLFSMTVIQSAQADAAPGPDPTVGGAGPYRPQKTKVQMLSETVLIEVPTYKNDLSNQISVSASFTMQNQGQAEEKMQVLFPLTRLNYIYDQESNYHVDQSSFVVRVNGKLLPTTEISTPAEKGYQLEWDSSDVVPSSGFNPEVRWAAFEVSFPVHKKVMLEVEYKMFDGSGGFTGIEYILETGAGWYGKILSADLILRLPYMATNESVEEANPGYVFSGNEMQWKLINLEPTRKDNLSVRVITPKNWQTVLTLRSRIEQNPDDAEAWYELGNKYQQLAIYAPVLGLTYSISSQHLADLSIESYEKAIALRPDWGKAHYQLANILWFSNPIVAKRFACCSVEGKDFIPSENPAIQRALQELRLAWSYGVTENGGSYGLVAYMNNAIPSLELTAPAPATATPLPPIETPIFTPTALIMPISTPTMIPPTPPTSIPTQISPFSAYGGLAAILLVIIGVLIYFWKSRLGSKR